MNTLYTQITVFNMDEVLFLLDRSCRIVDTGMRSTDDGCLYFAVTLEGEGIVNAHRAYFDNRPCQLTRLGVAFEAIMKAIGDKEAAEETAGGVA